MPAVNQAMQCAADMHECVIQNIINMLREKSVFSIIAYNKFTYIFTICFGELPV